MAPCNEGFQRNGADVVMEQLFRRMMRKGLVVGVIVPYGQFIGNGFGKDGVLNLPPDAFPFGGMNEDKGCPLVVVQFRHMQVHSPKVSQRDVCMPALLVGGTCVARRPQAEVAQESLHEQVPVESFRVGGFSIAEPAHHAE